MQINLNALYYTLIFSLCLAVAFSRKPRNYHYIGHGQSSLTNDSLKLFHLQICDRQKFQIKCPTHTKISIESAFYGYDDDTSKVVCDDPSVKQRQGKLHSLLFRDVHFEESQCEYLNAPTKIMEYCQNKEECGFKLRPNIFGFDSRCNRKASNILQISYKCRPSQFMSDYYCEDSSVELKCRNNQQNIAIYSAIYGRKTTMKVTGCDQGTVVSDCTLDVLERITQICHTQQFCSFNVTNIVLQTPNGLCSEDVKKYLNLVHICSNKINSLKGFNEKFKSIELSKNKISKKFELEAKFTFQSYVRQTGVAEGAIDKNVFDYKISGKDAEITFHKAWTPPKKIGKVEATTIARRKIDSSETIKNAMSDAAAFFPVSHIENVVHRTNDTIIEMIIAENQCSNFRWKTAEVQSCIPIYVPNFVSVLYFVVATTVHLKENKEQSILYFCLSSSGGLITFLVFFIGYQIFPKKDRSRPTVIEENKPSTSALIRRESYRESRNSRIEIFDLDDFDDLPSSTYRTLSRANSSVHTVRPYRSITPR